MAVRSSFADCGREASRGSKFESNRKPTMNLASGSDGQTPTQFEGLVETYYAPLYRFALALTRCESEAVDLTQHTFYTWACKGHQLRDAGKVKVWLFSVLRHEFLKRKRHQSRFVQSESLLELASAEEEEESNHAFAELDGAAAQDALLGLDDLHREPLALFYLQQHSYQEISEILEIPIGTVMSRIWRGKMKLRKILSRRLNEGREPTGL